MVLRKRLVAYSSTTCREGREVGVYWMRALSGWVMKDRDQRERVLFTGLFGCGFVGLRWGIRGGVVRVKGWWW